MTGPTTEQIRTLMALSDALDAVHNAGWKPYEIEEHVVAHLEDLYADAQEEDES